MWVYSKADVMFESLDYNKTESKFTVYYNKVENNERKSIRFYKNVKNYWSNQSLTIEEHKAINQKLIELEWLDEKE